MLKTVPGPVASLVLGIIAALSTPCGCVTAIWSDTDFERAQVRAYDATIMQRLTDRLGVGEVAWWVVPPHRGRGVERSRALDECVRLALSGLDAQTGSEGAFNFAANTQEICESLSRAEAEDAARVWRHASATELRSASMYLALEHLFLGLMLGLPVIAVLWTRARQPADGPAGAASGRRVILFVGAFAVITVQFLAAFGMLIGLSATESLTYLGLCGLALVSAGIMSTEVIWFAQPQVQRANAGKGPTPLTAALIGGTIVALLLVVGVLRAVLLLAGGADA